MRQRQQKLINYAFVIYTLITILAIFSTISQSFAQDVTKFIPQNCRDLKDVVSSETKKTFKEFNEEWYFGALFEHESCISLKHKNCCSPKSKLSTKRELGIGVGQITKAYNADGSVRFDTLSDLRNRYKAELGELNWGNIAERPDLQVRAVMLLTRSNYTRFLSVTDELERIKMTDSAYNGGVKAVLDARVVCGLAKGCNPQIWDKNTERYLKKSTKPIYAGRSAMDINLHHVRDVTGIRKPKYELLYKPSSAAYGGK